MKRQTLGLLILPIVLIALSGCVASPSNPLVFDFVATKETDQNWNLDATLWLPKEIYGDSALILTARLLCYSLNINSWNLEWDIDITISGGHPLLETMVVFTRSAGDPLGTEVLLDDSVNIYFIDFQESGDGIIPLQDRKFTLELTFLSSPGSTFFALDKSAGDI